MAVVNSMYEDASGCNANLDDWSDTIKYLSARSYRRYEHTKVKYSSIIKTHLVVGIKEGKDFSISMSLKVQT